METDATLNLLASIGAPTLGRFDDGKWYAKLKFPAPKGVSMEICSDFNHPTHESALTQLLARLGDVQPLATKIASANIIEMQL